jgi:hypothetical protein
MPNERFQLQYVANICKYHAKSKVPAPNRLQLARKMEGSSFQMLLQIAYEKESSNYKMLQIVCSMEGSSFKMLCKAE